MPLNSTLTADFMSTLFQAQADLIGSYTYPITLPLEPNQRFIENAQIIATDTSKRTLNVIFWLGASPFKQCKLYFTIETDQNGKSIINGNLYIDLALIVNQLKAIKLNQLAGEDMNLYSPESRAAFKDYITTGAAAPPSQYPYVFFPYKNEGAYIDAAYVLIPIWKSSVSYGVGNKVTFGNHIYQCIHTSGIGDDPVSWLDSQLVNTPQQWTDITVYPDIIVPVSDIINRWEIDDSGDAGFVVEDTFPIGQTYTPFFYLPYVLTRICAYFGFTVQSHTLTTDDFKRLTIYSNIPLNAECIIADFFNYMPAMLVSDFIKELRTDFGLMVDFDPLRKVCVIESLDYLETVQDVMDLQPFQTTQLRETGTQSQAFTIEQPADPNDKAYTDNDAINPTQLVIGDPNTAVQVTDIQLNSAPTKMIINQTPVPVFETLLDNPDMVITNQRIPWIKIPICGQSPLDQVSTVQFADRFNFKLRFLYYHGMQLDDGGFSYPYGSSDNLDINLKPLRPFTLSLTPSGTDYQAMQHYYTYLKNSKPLELIFQMARPFFAKLQNYRRIIIRDRNNASISCLISQVTATFTNGKDVIACRLTLYPKVMPSNLVEIRPPAPPDVTPPPFDNGTVFLQMIQDNPGEIISPIPPHYVTHTNDIKLHFYSDAGITVKDVTDLDVRYQVQEIHNTVVISTSVVKVSATSTAGVYSLLLSAPEDLTEGPNEWEWIYTPLPSALYTIIP